MISGKRIWILEDDVGSQFVYSEILGANYELKIFDNLTTFIEALSSTTELSPHLVVADIRLPDGSLLEFLETDLGRETFHRFSFIVVSSIDDLSALRLCFAKGAKDYLTKPFGRNELVIKIERILFQSDEPILPGTQVHLDITSMTLGLGDMDPSSQILTAKEFRLLSLLKNSPDCCATKKELMSAIWGDVKVTPKVLNVHLTNLRRKMEGLGLTIRHIPPDRYQLSLPDAQNKNRA